MSYYLCVLSYTFLGGCLQPLLLFPTSNTSNFPVLLSTDYLYHCVIHNLIPCHLGLLVIILPAGVQLNTFQAIEFLKFSCGNHTIITPFLYFLCDILVDIHSFCDSSVGACWSCELWYLFLKVSVSKAHFCMLLSSHTSAIYRTIPSMIV